MSVSSSPPPLPAVLTRTDDAPFLGRDAELARLRDAWRAASGLVVISGEPGIGKTRLAARFAVSVYDEGAVVLSGRADEESVWPGQAFIEALRHYAAHRPGLVEDAQLPPAAAHALATLVPELGVPVEAEPADPPDRNRHQLVEAVVRLLLHAARPRGLLLILDDLHWADASTTLLLRHVLRRAAGSRLLVLATIEDRLPRGADGLQQLRRDAAFETIRLPGLAPSEVAALIAGRAPTDDASLGRLCDETGGNPFFIEELLRNPESAADAPRQVPEGVKHVIGRRLQQLPPSALEILTVAAVLGTDFTLKALEAVTPEREQDELLDTLEAAVAAGLILEDAEHVDRFSFSHSLVRETLYERPIASRRVRLHRQVAEALEFSPLPVHPAELAHHYFEAREVGGADKAIVFGLEAGAAAQVAHAYDAAVDHYERVLGLLPLVGRDDPVARCDLLLALGETRWRASRPNPGTTFVEAFELARAFGSADRQARAVLGMGGRFYAPVATDVAYAELLAEALGVLGTDDSALRVRLLARLAENLVLTQPEQARRLADEALGMARRLAEPGSLASALMGRHAALLHVAYASERSRIGEELIAVAGELEDPALGALARHWLLYDLAELGEIGQARQRQAELERIADQLQQPLYRHSALAWRGVWAGLEGRFEEAERLARESVRLAQGAGARDAQTHFTAQLVAIRREQGRLDELLPQIERLAGGDAQAAAWRSLLPLAYLDAGDRDSARAAYEQAAESRSDPLLWLTATGLLCEAAAELGDAEGGARLYDELSPYADRLIQWTFTGNAGSAHGPLARAAAVADRVDDACAHFEAAVAHHAELGAPALLARSRCDYGEFLVRTGANAPRGRRLLREAAGTARRLGMSGVAARAARRLNGEDPCSY